MFVAVAVLFLHSPKIFMQSFLDGVTVWALNVLPALFPFAVLSPIALAFFPRSKRSFSSKLFGVDADGIYLASLLCGYPIGAKAIAESNLDADSAECACAFCSSASPVFVVATVGAALLQNSVATAVLVVCHLLSTLVCGLFFRRRHDKSVQKQSLPLFSFGDIGSAVTNAVLSVLYVGGLIALFYMLCDMAKSLLPEVLSQSAVVGFLLGLLEMTNGVIFVCSVCDVFSAMVLCGFLLAFGGLCVFCQSMTFLSKKNVSPLKFLKMRLVQGSVASLSAFVLGKIFL